MMLGLFPFGGPKETSWALAPWDMVNGGKGGFHVRTHLRPGPAHGDPSSPIGWTMLLVDCLARRLLARGLGGSGRRGARGPGAHVRPRGEGAHHLPRSPLRHRIGPGGSARWQAP